MTLLGAMWTFPSILELLMWAGLLVLNLWVWQKTKAQGNLLMLVGAGAAGLSALIMVFTGEESIPGAFVWLWLPVIGLGIFLAGFYLSVKPMVEAQISGLKSKIQEATKSKEGEGSAAATPPPPPAGAEGGEKKDEGGGTAS